jgi:hypothetical protein
LFDPCLFNTLISSPAFFALETKKPAHAERACQGTGISLNAAPPRADNSNEDVPGRKHEMNLIKAGEVAFTTGNPFDIAIFALFRGHLSF